MTEVAINFRKTAYYLSFSPKAALFTVTKLKTKKKHKSKTLIGYVL